MITTIKAGKDIKPLQMPNKVLFAGLLLGLATDRLWFANGPLGPGFMLWVGLCSSAAIWAVKRTQAADRHEVSAWCLAAIFAAMVLIWRTSPPVILAMLLVLITTAVMVIMQKNSRGLRDITLQDGLHTFVRLPGQCLLAPFRVLAKVDFGAGMLDPRFRAVCRGLLLAAPVLAIFSALFASADLVFSRQLERALGVFSPQSLDHLLITLLFGWVATGLLAGVSEKHFLVERPSPRIINLGSADTATLLGLVLLLFLCFVALQVGYLFGGQSTIEATAGLTLADYARRGFFEMLAVAGLTLALLVAVAHATTNQRLFRPLASAMIACVGVMLLSACQRMLLYVDQFGLTLDRLTALWAMAWIALCLGLFATTLLRGRNRDFPAGLALSAVLLAFLFALSNPAASVSAINIERSAVTNNELDTQYLLRLGPDAVPTLLEQLDTLPTAAQCQLADGLLQEWSPVNAPAGSQAMDWRWWNASKAAAARTVRANFAKLTALRDGPCTDLL